MPEKASDRSANLHLEVDGGTKAIPASRRTVEGLDEYVGDECTDKVRLLVSEVVTNAVVHGGADVAVTLQLTMRVTSKLVRVEVTDPGGGFDASGGPPGSDREIGGWGLVLVDKLADRWGTEQEPQSKVWFEIDRESPSAC